MVQFPAVAVVLLLSRCVRAWDLDNCCSCHLVRCVPAGDLVFVPCPSPWLLDDAEVSFRLEHSEEMVHYDFSKSRWKRSELDAGLEENVTMAKRRTEINVKMHLNTTASDGWARFALVGVAAEDSGLYRCSAKVIFPAPVLTLCNASTVDLRLEGHQCEAPVVCGPPVSGPPEGLSTWIWIGAVAALGVYALLVTVVASVKIVRVNKDELNQSEYMNTQRVAR
ncbi:T-cell-specific surface glycoprotein CD28-like isoform X2 [Gadus macrocephalus]|uniref:T-cell-specific surface glycoprotein CD28-like isoform X2 n=1 Tax=Gadus macrocephalus TaxID=80720 RepID=UPI0028CB94E1|nr:T-cell-specific surface glycoprotein CD28-like isoform X2 [Gadus macrocephalus]